MKNPYKMVSKFAHVKRAWMNWDSNNQLQYHTFNIDKKYKNWLEAWSNFNLNMRGSSHLRPVITILTFQLQTQKSDVQFEVAWDKLC